MNRTFLFSFQVLLILLNLGAKAQDGIENRPDTLHVISFDSLVKIYFQRMVEVNELEDTLSLEDALKMIKIENTILKGMIDNTKKSYICFSNYLYRYLRQKLITKVEATLTGGFGYYSEKYNILFGGYMTHPQSYYYIKDNL